MKKTAGSSTITNKHEPAIITVPDIFAACERIVSSGGRVIEGPAPASLNLCPDNYHDVFAHIEYAEGKRAILIERIMSQNGAGLYL